MLMLTNLTNVLSPAVIKLTRIPMVLNITINMATATSLMKTMTALPPNPTNAPLANVVSVTRTWMASSTTLNTLIWLPWIKHWLHLALLCSLPPLLHPLHPPLPAAFSTLSSLAHCSKHPPLFSHLYLYILSLSLYHPICILFWVTLVNTLPPKISFII